MDLLNTCKDHYPELQWEQLNEKSEKYETFGGLGYEVYLGSIVNNPITLSVRRTSESDVSLSLMAVSKEKKEIFETNRTNGKMEDMKTLFNHLNQDWRFPNPRCKEIFINQGYEEAINEWQSKLWVNEQ